MRGCNVGETQTKLAYYALPSQPSLGPTARLKAGPLAWARVGTDGCRGGRARRKERREQHACIEGTNERLPGWNTAGPCLPLEEGHPTLES